VRVTSLSAFVSKGSIRPSHIRDEAGPPGSTTRAWREQFTEVRK